MTVQVGELQRIMCCMHRAPIPNGPAVLRSLRPGWDKATLHTWGFDCTGGSGFLVQFPQPTSLEATCSRTCTGVAG